MYPGRRIHTLPTRNVPRGMTMEQQIEHAASELRVRDKMFHYMRNCKYWRPFYFIKENRKWVDYLTVQVFPFLQTLLESRESIQFVTSETSNTLKIKRNLPTDFAHARPIVQQVYTHLRNPAIRRVIIHVSFIEHPQNEDDDGMDLWCIFYRDFRAVELVSFFAKTQPYYSQIYSELGKLFHNVFKTYKLKWINFPSRYSVSVHKDFDRRLPSVRKEGYLVHSSAFYALWSIYALYSRLAQLQYSVHDLKLLAMQDVLGISVTSRMQVYIDFLVIVETFSAFLVEITHELPNFQTHIWSKCSTGYGGYRGFGF